MLYTDHQAIKSLYNAPITSGIQARWITVMQQYLIDIVIQAGPKHGNSDAISRNPSFRLRLTKKGKILLSEEEDSQ